ncbi:hypothetical protein [Herbaspirillum sp.]|uniref:hypothetical protein n=1 Tax=Herbaspirillum sp. TaxID=1890675 RepID=UPI00258A40E0|nr:hypothetical protein [Herbaspirillum sp.]
MKTDLAKRAATASVPSLQGRGEIREWIGGRALTLLSHYWRDDDPGELTAAIGADWADVLEWLPPEYIQRACIKYQRDEPKRKPTPGAIYQMARKMLPRPDPAPPRAEPDRLPRVSAEAATEIMIKAGFRPRKMEKKP